MSKSPGTAKPKPNTIQSISNFNKFQGSEELLAHPERWIEATERQPKLPPPPQQRIRCASPTGTSSRSTLPTHPASDASQPNRNRSGIRNENETRDLIRGSTQSRTQIQAHDPTRHLLRDQIPSRTRSRLLSQQQKQTAMAMYAPTIPTPPTPIAPIDINITTATLTPKSDSAVPSATSPSPPRRPFIHPTPFRASVPQPQPSQAKQEREAELRTLTTEMRKRSDRGIGSFSKSELRTLAAPTRERAVRRDGSGSYPTFASGPRAEWHNEDSEREVVGTTGVYNTEKGPRRTLQALRHTVPVEWTSRAKREEGVELLGRQTRVEVEDGRDGIRQGVAKYLGERGETGERVRRCKPPPAQRPSTMDQTSAHRQPGPLNIRPAFENDGALEVEEDAKRSAEEERTVSERSGNGVEAAERVARMNTNTNRRMRRPDGSGLEIAAEEAAEDAEWVLVPAPALAANLQDAEGEEVEVEVEVGVEIEVEAENEAEWYVVRT